MLNPFSYDAALDACNELLAGNDSAALIAARVATDSPLSIEWRILVEMKPDGPFETRWTDCGEGPWRDPFEALLFADDHLTRYMLAGVIPEMSS